MNTLYYGDNLDVLRIHVKDESVDLVYLDPPFKSNQSYNVLFAEQDGSRSAAQIKAFEDTWRWDQAAAGAFENVVEGGGRVSRALQAFRTFLSESDMLAYLAMMAPRFVELRRVLKPTGSIYLHCDPTASHYLKMLMDAVFDPRHFVNEIIWKRTTAHSDAKQGSQHFGRTHDVLLFYSKGDDYTWNPQYGKHDPEYIESHYTQVDESGRRYRWDNLTGPGGAAKGNPFYEVLGVKAYWRYSKTRMQDLIDKGLVAIPPKGKIPALKRYLDEQAGRPVGDTWTDIPAINSQAQERLGYPTQKPESLLERIIKTSSNQGDVVLDPFCGCGTAIAASHKLGRPWIGIDITQPAIVVVKQRLARLGLVENKDYRGGIGEPVSVPDAEVLAAENPYQFQWWALGKVNARPTDERKGPDRGIDGRLYFFDDQKGSDARQIVFSVKAGALKATAIRDLRGVMAREGAEIGVLLSMADPTRSMRVEAASAGFYTSPWGRHPRLQILTVAELLAGKKIDYPPAAQVNITYKKPPKASPAPRQEQLKIAEAEAIPWRLAPAKAPRRGSRRSRAS